MNVSPPPLSSLFVFFEGCSLSISLSSSLGKSSIEGKVGQRDERTNETIRARQDRRGWWWWLTRRKWGWDEDDVSFWPRDGLWGFFFDTEMFVGSLIARLGRRDGGFDEDWFSSIEIPAGFFKFWNWYVMGSNVRHVFGVIQKSIATIEQRIILWKEIVIHSRDLKWMNFILSTSCSRLIERILKIEDCDILYEEIYFINIVKIFENPPCIDCFELLHIFVAYLFHIIWTLRILIRKLIKKVFPRSLKTYIILHN